MKTIQIKTQAEWDALPSAFTETTVIEIRSSADTWIRIQSHPESSHVVAWESSHVEAWGSSHVEAWGSSHVEARESSHVVAWESSHVEAWGSSHVEAWESSHVVARESSHVVARESSHVVAWVSSHVEAWGSSHVEAWESSHVEAWGSVSVSNHSEYSTLELYGFAVAILIAKAKKLLRKSKSSTVVRPTCGGTTSGWIEREGVNSSDGFITIFKRVSHDFKTQEGTTNETIWQVGSTLECGQWNPKEQECNNGKFHACSRPYFCDQFRSNADDKYVALRVNRKDVYVWPKNPEYPHKIAVRKAFVLYECDRYGDKIQEATC
jgi:hypothetical protein